jgi:hypothetical protein
LGDRVSVLDIFIFGTNNSHRGLGASLHGIVGYSFLFLGLFLFTATFILFRLSDYLATALGGYRQGGRCLGECAFGLLWGEGGNFALAKALLEALSAALSLL